nr:unnamed protein product [Digitaria exilis]
MRRQRTRSPLLSSSSYSQRERWHVRVDVGNPLLRQHELPGGGNLCTELEVDVPCSPIVRNQKIHWLHWRSLVGLPNRGAVRFFPKSPSSCIVQLTVEYEIPEILAQLNQH